MNANISFNKDKLKIKGKGKKVIIPLDPRYGRPWEQPNDGDIDGQHLYQIMQNNEYTIQPNINREIYFGSPISSSQNFDLKLYNW